MRPTECDRVAPTHGRCGASPSCVRRASASSDCFSAQRCALCALGFGARSWPYRLPVCVVLASLYVQ